MGNDPSEMTKEVRSACHLRMIGQAAMVYAEENGGRMPDDIGTLRAHSNLALEVFVNPRVGTAAPQGLDAAATWRWLDGRADYVYAGKGKTESAAADLVLAYERPGTVADGLNILFCDGHVEYVRTPRALEIIEKGTSYLG